MGGSTDKDTALRLLHSLENGGRSAKDAAILAADLDPVLVYFIVRHLRETYPASDPAATAVLDRVVALTSAFPGLVAKSQEGELDSVSEWFAGEYTFGSFRGQGDELIALIVNKLES